MKRQIAIPQKVKWPILLLLLIATCTISLKAQQGQRQISGTVTDSTNAPLNAVSIMEKGTKKGVTTNAKGAFKINVSENAILIFSLTGYNSEEVYVANNVVIKVVLFSRFGVLNEVVVIGYGSQKKSDVTGSVTSVKASDIADRITNNPLEALSGKVPGLNIYNNSGRPGGKLSVNLRGFNSISASNVPLFVIDGVVGADIQSLNPNDVETIDVLKDASSTAIYGSRGANGVIIVSTRKGKNGDFSVKYDGNISVNTVARQVSMLDSKGWMEWFKRAWAYDTKRGPLPNLYADYPDLFKADGSPIYNTNWQKEATQNAVSQRHFISLSQGTAKSRTGLYLGYQDDQGIMKKTYQKKYSARFNNEMNIKPWMTIGGELAYNHIKSNIVDDYRVGAENVTRMTLEMLPIFPVKYPNGQQGRLSDFGYNFNPDGSHYKASIYSAENPVRLLNELQWIFNNDQVLANAYVNVKLAKGLELKSTLSAQILSVKNNLYVGKDLLDLGTPTNGVASVGFTKNNYIQNENYLTYNKAFGEAHKFNAVLGTSWQQTFQESLEASATGFSTDYFQYNNLSAGSVRGTPQSNYYDYRLNSYYSRINYAYQGKYLLTLTGRYDGSSKFGKDNKYAFFPSGAIGWIVSQEKFLSENNVVSFLKLRASHGITGNSEIDPYASLGTVGNYSVTLNGQIVNGVGPGSVPNSNLKWEQTAQTDIGMDLNLFKKRVSIVADYYYKKTTNLLLNVPISIVSGYGAVTTNIGSMQNKGFEIALSGVVIQKKDFDLGLSVLYAANTNKILALGSTNADVYPGPNFLGQTNILQVGQSVGNFWGFERIGTWGEKEAAEAAKYGKKPGDIKRLDVNGDQKFDNTDAMVLGNMFPKYEMTYSTNIRYKNWALTADIQVRNGNKIANITTLTIEDRQHYANSYATILKDAWTPQNQNTQVPSLRFAHTDPFGTDLTFFMDSRWIEDGSFVRGKSANLAYTVPPNVLKRIGVSALRLYFNVQNFFLITKFRGYDPEVSTFSGSFAQGIEFYSTPRPRSFTFGINLNL
jgi:TonB-dependent starch-binding outer membrane protein SusC